MNVQDILRKYNVPIAPDGHKNVRQGNCGFDCPKCSPNASAFYAAFMPGGHGAFCWRCGRLNVASTLMALTGQPWNIVKGWLDDRTGEHHEPTPRGKLIMPKGCGPMLPAHHNYLKGRGLDPERMEQLWGLQGIGVDNKLAWRILIPIQHEGQTVSWTTRTIGDKEPRYWSAQSHEEAMDHRRILNGEDYVRHTIIVLEGPFDRMRIGPGAVDTGGMGLTKEQILAISKYPHKVLVPDNEYEAIKRARQLQNDLAPFPGKVDLVELDAKDAGSAPESEIQKLRRIFLGD